MAETKPSRRPARRARARRATLIGAGLVVLAGAVVLSWWLWGRQAPRLPQPQTPGVSGLSPRYLGSFGDTGTQRLVEPLGIAVAGDHVYVADAGARAVAVFDLAGKRVATLSGGGLRLPAYVAVDPRDGRVLVSDRLAGSMVVFGADGKAEGVFDPKLPEGVAATGTVAPWRPLAAAFAPDGTLYVTDTSREHRVLVFSPDGSFLRALTGSPSNALSYPNGVAAMGRDVIVADSNNARLLVFAPDGSVSLEIPTGGLPRGVAVVTHRRGTTVSSDLVVADTIGRRLTFWAPDGASLGSAGRAGSGGGEFAFPTDVTAAGDGTVYVTDTGNKRVQMWVLGSGFSAPAARASSPETSPWWPYAAGGAAVAALIAAFCVLVVRRSRARRSSSETGAGSDERRERPRKGAERGPDEV